MQLHARIKADAWWCISGTSNISTANAVGNPNYGLPWHDYHNPKRTVDCNKARECVFPKECHLHTLKNYTAVPVKRLEPRSVEHDATTYQ